MRVEEDVVVRRRSYDVEDSYNVYPEIRDLLNEKMSFDDVNEVKTFTEVEEGQKRAKIETLEVYDNFFMEELEILLTIKPGSVQIEVKAELVANYDFSGWRDNIIYYGYRALFHKFIGIKNQHSYEEAIEEKVDQLFRNLDKILK